MPATYASLDEASDYFQWATPSEAWDDASPTERAKALVTATRAIDRLNFAGLRTSDWSRLVNTRTPIRILDPAPVGQDLEFPRNGETTIPQPIKDATCEIAYALLDGVDPEMESQSLEVSSQNFSAVSTSYDTTSRSMAIRNGIVSRTAWGLIYPYLASPYEINLVRVS